MDRHKARLQQLREALALVCLVLRLRGPGLKQLVGVCVWSVSNTVGSDQYIESSSACRCVCVCVCLPDEDTVSQAWHEGEPHTLSNDPM